jgi:hypothetical protein
MVRVSGEEEQEERPLAALFVSGTDRAPEMIRGSVDDGGPRRGRTGDQKIKSLLLYQLS